MSDGDDVPPSVLGRREYWEGVYATERRNFESFGDEGEVWFGASVARSELRLIDELCADRVNDEILDIGTGNGAFLVACAESLGCRRLCGVDYSAAGIEMARQIAESHGLGFIQYMQLDVRSPAPAALRGRFHFVHDKGTFDAVSMSDAAQADKKGYADFVYACMRPDAHFLIT